MIAFGVPILDEDLYLRCAAPSIATLAEPDSIVIHKRGYDSIQQPYNEILDEAAEHEDLEAVVLLHQDTWIDAPKLPQMIRWHFRDPTIGVIGAVGARGVDSMAWASGAAEPLGAVNIPVLSSARFVYSTGTQLADAVDGYLLIVSRRVAHTIRFDERGRADFHGYDVDFCFRVRARGFRVIVEDLTTKHFSAGGDPTLAGYGRAYARWEQTWNPARWPPEWRGSAPYGFFRPSG